MSSLTLQEISADFPPAKLKSGAGEHVSMLYIYLLERSIISDAVL